MKTFFCEMFFGTPKVVNNKVLCVAILKDGNETTSLFTLEEISKAIKESKPPPTNDDSNCENHILYIACGYIYCPNCGDNLGE